MAKPLDLIKAPIREELEMFEKHFRDAMKSNVALLDRIMFYIVRRKGKQIRPIFIFLSAKAAGGCTDSTYNAASLIELLHTATLVHDDVVDESMERRGFFSINALWKNKVAVLVGDYLLSQGLLLSVNNNEFELLRIVAKAVKDMSEGELLQIEKARDWTSRRKFTLTSSVKKLLPSLQLPAKPAPLPQAYQRKSPSNIDCSVKKLVSPSRSRTTCSIMDRRM